MVTPPKRPLATASKQPVRPGKSRLRLLVIEARYYESVSDALLEGARAEMEASGVAHELVTVPGALEIPHALAQACAAGIIGASASVARYAGAVALGCVIRGETSHYDIVCNNANHWLNEVAIRDAVPLGNAILTVENEEQAMARAKGGRQGKGADAVRACLKLAELARAFQGQEL